MALAYCAARWAKPRGIELLAVIVDHRLRPESEEEAQNTKTNLEKLGIPTEIKVWQHEKVASRIHVQAREARFTLLEEACLSKGFHHLALAHHLRDQAETVLLRLAKGSGTDGLSGMPPIGTLGKLTLLRPLLPTTKERLIATCEAAGLAYAIDPTNEAPKYARGRLRALWPLLEKEGLTPERLSDLADRAREDAEALRREAETLLHQAAQQRPSGAILMDRTLLMEAPKALALRALDLCLRTLHPGPYRIERASLLRLYEEMEKEGPFETRSLNGCLISAKGETEPPKAYLFLRDMKMITESPQIKPGNTFLWDGRWNVTLSLSWEGPPPTIRPLGNLEHAVLDKLDPFLRKKIPSGRERASLPTLFAEDRVILPPILEEIRSDSVFTTFLEPPLWEKEQN